MKSDPIFIEPKDAELIHELQHAEFGGGTGLRNRSAFESAVGTASTSFGGEYLHPDLFTMGAAYAFHIAQNQPFLDGNKRTGLLCALVFLELNGVTIRDPNGRLHDAMIALAERRLDKPGLAALFGELAAR